MFEDRRIIASPLAPIPMKQVSYHNHQLTVPIDTRYITADADGEIYTFPKKPKYANSIWSHSDGVSIGTFDSKIGIEAARESLVEYEHGISVSSSYWEMQPYEADFYGIRLTLSKKFAWIAFDYNGAVYAYTAEPIWDEHQMKWAPADDDVECLFVGNLDVAHLIGAEQSMMCFGEDYD